MKKTLFLSILLIGFSAVHSCPVCKKQQPRILRDITHGSGPQGNWDYIIISIAVVIVLVSIFFSLKYLFLPGEQSKKHIKRLVLNYD
jgi:hypothetical protein